MDGMGMGEMAAMGGMARPMVDRALCDGPMLAALLLVFGMAVFAVAVVPAPSDFELVPHQLWTMLRTLALIALVLAPLRLLTSVAAMAETTVAEAVPLAPQVVRQTHFGKIWLSSQALLVVLAVTAWVPGRSRVRMLLIAILGAALLMLWALAGHAVDHGIPAIVIYCVHEAAAALWAGALVGLWFVARRGGMEEPRARGVAERVSRLCGWCIAALVASGAYTAYRGLGLNIDHLLYSAYGRTLIAKVALFGVVLTLGSYNRYWLVPQFQRAPARHTLLQTVRVECFLLIGVLVLAVLLANTPPPH